MTVHKDLIGFDEDELIRVKRSGVYPGPGEDDVERLGIVRIEPRTDHPVMTLRVEENFAVGTAAQMLALLYKRYNRETVDRLVALAVEELQASFSGVEN